jgi:peptide-methionine (R)-S-oxide reductase
MKDQWKGKLSPEQLYVCHLGGTEAPFSGKYDKHYEPGAYVCVACGEELFKSDHKFNSGSGWPSFFDVARAGSVRLVEDRSHGMLRTEARCANCDAHLGHVFDDGPAPTRQRWCINSLSLDFVARGA